MKRYLANENFPHTSTLHLRENGLDVLEAAVHHPGASDREVLEWATAEGRIFLTFDRDYGELI